MPIVLSTDVGLKRKENQDRVIAARISTKNSRKRPTIAIAVADGMGGMRDGAQCATLALSSFVYALTEYADAPLQHQAQIAIAYANLSVHNYADGRGGATLSAVLINHEIKPISVNVGDSRIYSFMEQGQVKRLTTDDSLEEAMGGHGRDLLQFIGIGEGIKPHIQDVPTFAKNVAITTDGIHYIEPKTLESILTNSSDFKVASERLAAIARWCGGHDNATSALVDLQALVHEVKKEDDETSIQVWDAFGGYSMFWEADGANSDVRRKLAATEVLSPRPKTYEKPTKVERKTQEVTPRRRESLKQAHDKKQKKGKRTSPVKENIQLEIAIERPTEAGESDKNSR